MSNSQDGAPRVCASCGSPRETAGPGDYACASCGLELAHLDIAPNGMVRGVYGWLHAAGHVLHDRYEVLKILGKGGFAATYLVADRRLSGKRCAVKEIPEVLFDAQEMEILSRLRHTAIPDVTDRFHTEGMEYLVLELGGDRTLESERKAAGGRVPLERVCQWGRELCDVMSYLHEQDPPVIHRDLKPENVLLDERGRIMLIDFGIAKETSSSTETRTVARSVSHGFSPPEQALGTGTDERSDVYALGATFYTLLTGRILPPAHERLAGAEMPSPRESDPQIPADLEAAIVKALNLNINQRQQSIDELAAALEPAAAPATGPTRTSAGTAPPAPPPVSARAPAPGSAAPRTVMAPVSVPASAPAAARGGRPTWLPWAVAAGAILVAGALTAGIWRGGDESPASEAPAEQAAADAAGGADCLDCPLPRPESSLNDADLEQTGSARDALAGRPPALGTGAQRPTSGSAGSAVGGPARAAPPRVTQPAAQPPPPRKKSRWTQTGGSVVKKSE